MSPNQPSNASTNETYIVSTLTFRTVIGVLGIILPIALWLANGTHLEPSISEFYGYSLSEVNGALPPGTPLDPALPPFSRNVLEMIMACVGAFLCCYMGYDVVDRGICRAAGIAGISVAVFPAEKGTGWVEQLFVSHWPSLQNTGWLTGLQSTIHFLAGAVFLLSLGYMSFKQFTKTDKTVQPQGSRKHQRDLLYHTCGIIIFAALALVALSDLSVHLNLLSQDFMTQYCVVFWMESVSVWAFGLSWIIKGEVLLKDAVPADSGSGSRDPQLRGNPN